jgi:hypothetical protein
MELTKLLRSPFFCTFISQYPPFASIQIASDLRFTAIKIPPFIALESWRKICYTIVAIIDEAPFAVLCRRRLPPAAFFIV